MRHVISALVINEPGVLANVAGMFAARGFNIDSLVVGRTENPEYSRMTVVVDADDNTLEQVRKQLAKLVPVAQVRDFGEMRYIERDLALITVSCTTANRSEIVELVNLFRGKVVDIGRTSLVCELAGPEEKIEAFIDLLQPYGIKEVARTGVIAIARGSTYKRDETAEKSKGTAVRKRSLNAPAAAALPAELAVTESCMNKEFDYALASTLWTQLFDFGLSGWTARLEVETVAGRCGLGVLCIDALNIATAGIIAEMKCGRNWCEETYARLPSSDFQSRWSEYLVTAHRQFPDQQSFPIARGLTHVVDDSLCVNHCRKGAWTDACFRAAWGNVLPYGLSSAVKNCPECSQEMRYWCYGKSGEDYLKWSVDHKKPHRAGGCGCQFNLQAIHARCNSAKNGRWGDTCPIPTRGKPAIER